MLRPIVYLTGERAKYEDPPPRQMWKRKYGAYVKAKVNLGPAHVGGTFGYSSGDDRQDPTKNKTGPVKHDGLDPNLFFANRTPGPTATALTPATAMRPATPPG